MIDWKNNYEKEFLERTNSAINWMLSEFNKIRVGRANPAILDGILVDAYGDKMPLNQVSNMNIPEPRIIVIKPYDKALLKDINSAIASANIGIAPQLDADSIKLVFPTPTEEMRKENVKKIKAIAEQAKVDVRKVRQILQDQFKKDETATQDDKKYFEKELDAITKKINTKIDELFSTREKEILKI